MAGHLTLDDLLLAHDGINDTIRQFYPHLHQQEDQNQDEDEEKEADSNDRSTTTTTILPSEMEQKVSGFLESVSALEAAREELALTVENAHNAMLSQASSALTDPKILGQRVAWCVQAEQHMGSIVENKDLLIYHLQQPLVSTFLTMHHKHHRSLVSLVGALCDLLNRLQSHTDLLERHAKHSALSTSDSMISSLTRVVVTQRDLLNDITALKTLVNSVLQETVT